MPSATVKLLEPVLALEPNYYHAKRMLGYCYVQVGRVNEGLKLLYEAVQQEPDKLEGWDNLCWSLTQLGRWDELDRVWQRIPESLRQQPELLRYRGQWAEATGDIKRAAEIYRQALEINPYDRKLHYRLARVLHRLGDKQAADEHEQRAKELDRLREELGSKYQAAISHPGKLTPAECQEIAQLCRALGLERQCQYWEREAKLRVGTTLQQAGL